MSEIISIDTPIVEKKKTTSANPDDLAKLLEGYNEPMKVSTDTPPVNNISQPQQSNSNQYYVRGPKKGHLKPPSSVKVSYNPPQNHVQVDGELISAVLFLTMIDMIFPMIFIMINNRFSKKKMEMEMLQLTAQQKKALEPVTEALVKELKMKGNPMVVFPLSLLCMYGANYAMLKMAGK